MKEMSFEEHLTDLRKTLIRIIIILIISFFVAYSIGDLISEFLLLPLRNTLEQAKSGQIVYLGLLDKILSQFQVAFWSSILISSPFWFYELWKFIRPGLFDYEAKVVRPFILVGFLLFVLGVCFGYYLVFPVTFGTLMSFGVDNVTATIGLKDYLVLCSKVLVFLGLVFQLPNLMLILGFMGVITKYSLKSMRKYIYLGLLVLSAMITPPDILTMLGLWFPLVILFEIGILAVALIVHPYLAKQHT